MRQKNNIAHMGYKDHGRTCMLYAQRCIRCITGEIPPESIGRIRGDRLKKISEFRVKCPSNIEEAILKGLNSDRKERFQSMKELYVQLYDQVGKSERKERQSEQYIEKGTQKEKKLKKKSFLEEFPIQNQIQNRN